MRRRHGALGLWALGLWTLGLWTLGSLAAAAPASAQTAPGLDIRIERDTRSGILASDLVVNLKVTVTDRTTAAPPQDRFEVYASAEQPAGTRTEIFPCAHERDSSPDVAPGIYLCTVLVDHGGRWQFSGVVNRLRADPDDPPVVLGRAATDLDIVTDEVAAAADEDRIRGRLFEVALLWGHAGAAAVWLLAVALIGILAFPALRQRLSPFGLHRLEDRFDLLARSLWGATGLLVASGTYLLLNQTAYETPFSAARIEAAFRLPYGKPYFVTLAVKLAVYAAMVAAGAVLHAEARRRLRAQVVVVPATPDDPSPWHATRPDGRGRGRTAVVDLPPIVETPAAAEQPDAPSGAVRAGALVLVAGTVSLSLTITLLKYFHELIEAARAVL
ncbi:MAG TPA: hypothetical protein VFS16_04340 [Acidimicrobiia bacterium]|nr:hypothetical protein [Acidimicrobiia bacterium]